MSHSDNPYRSLKDAENLRRIGLPSSSVHPLETTVETEGHSLSIQDDSDAELGISFRHSGWAAARRKTWEALNRTGADAKRLERFRACGSQPYVYQSTDDPELFRLGGNYCHDKLCQPCAATRSRLVTGNLARNIVGRDLRFLTLTILDEGDDLEHILKHLSTSFRRLRAEPQWKTHVFGGCAFTEIKYNFDPDHWHIHLHMLIEGTYFPQATIRELWRKATRGSYIVDIRPVRDEWSGANEVAKYAGKPMGHALTWRADLLDQAATALAGRRLFTCFGGWRGFKLSELPEKGHWQAYAPLGELMDKCRNDDITAIRILTTLGIVPGPIMFGRQQDPRPPPEPVITSTPHVQTLLASSLSEGQTPTPWAKPTYADPG